MKIVFCKQPKLQGVIEYAIIGDIEVDFFWGLNFVKPKRKLIRVDTFFVAEDYLPEKSVGCNKNSNWLYVIVREDGPYYVYSENKLFPDELRKR